MTQSGRRINDAISSPPVLASLAILSVVLVTFVGVAWFLLLVAIANLAAVVAMVARAKNAPTPSQILQVIIGLLIVAAFLAFAVALFASGDVSLLGALLG